MGKGHEHAERKTWFVIWLCGAMMIVEIIGGVMFGSIALVADGLHMSTHAGALLLAALAYRYSRKYAHDPRFSFGTGKLGDLAGFTSAIVLAMTALLIGYESIHRFMAPVPIYFGEAISIAVLGLLVNLGSVWLLSSGGHHHHHEHVHDDHEHDECQEHAHGHASAHHDNNLRAAIIHVMADLAVSVLVIAGLVAARLFGWLWMDPVAGLIGALVITVWSYGLMRDTGAILLDMSADQTVEKGIRQMIEADGDQLSDLHVWRLGPSHLGAIVCVVTHQGRDANFYRARLARFRTLSHLTIEVQQAS